MLAYTRLKKVFHNICLNFNTLSIVLFVVGTILSCIIPIEIHKISVESIKKSYTEFSKNAQMSVEDVFNVSTTPSVLSQVMGSFNVSPEQFSIFAEAATNIHDIGSTLYSVKIPNSGISEFEVTASEIHGVPIKIKDERFNEISNYTEEYLWPVLYEYFPTGPSGSNLDFRGFNMYWGQLREKFDEMVRTKLLVYSDPILFVSSNTTGLLLIRPVIEENEVTSCIVRGIRPSNFLFNVDIDLLKEEFGSDICIYIQTENVINLLFSSGRTSPELPENCHKTILSTSSFMLLCISDLVDKKISIGTILSIIGGILVSLLISILFRTLHVISDTEKKSKIKSRLIAHVSHELRTPMNAIMGLSELIILEKNNLSNSCSRYIDSIYASGKILLSIIDDVLDMSDIESNRMTINNTDMNLRNLIHASVQTTWLFSQTRLVMDDGIKPDIVLSLHILCSVPTSSVNGDSSKISQIISNLVSNSLKFTKEGTVDIVVTTKIVDAGLLLEISVTDTGIGMTAQKMKTIFDPFLNSKNDSKINGSGTGLGLAICKNLAELMGGRIKCKSVFGKGTTFYFSCILTYSGTVITDIEEDFVFSKEYDLSNAHRRYSDTKPLVLVVDDIRINRLVLTKMLESMGISTMTCNNGAESVESCKNHKFSAILMDIFMPVLDGIDATKVIRKFSGINKDTPIIFVSATVESSYIQKCHDAGGNSFIKKPVTMGTLSQELECLIT